MNSDYHTSDAARQSCTCGAGSWTNFSARLVAARSSKPLCISETTIPSHPVLVGDRETLRKLRAAETATWESARPQTTVAQNGPGEKLWRQGARRSSLGESLSFLLLSVCAGAASFAGFGDMSELVNRWSLFVQGIRNLLG